MIIADDPRDRSANVELRAVRRNRRIGIAALAVCLGATFALPFVVGSLAWLPVLVGLFGAWASIGYLVSLSRGPGERELTPAQYRIQDDGIAIREGSSVVVVRREDVESSWSESASDVPVVLLRLKDGRQIALQPTGSEGPSELFEALSLPPAAKAERLRLGRDNVGARVLSAMLLAPIALLGLPIALATLASMPGITVLMTLVPMALFGAAAYWLTAKVLPSWVSIGTDGVLVQKLRKTFIPYSDLVDARIDGGPVYYHVVLLTASGKQLKVPVAQREQGEVVVGQLDAAMEGFRMRRRAALVSELSQGDRDVEAWRAGLQSILSESGYRSAAVDREQLLRVLEDPGQPEKVRVAAAVALQPSATEEEKVRVRVAADASASPKVRVALQEAVEGELENRELEAMR